MMQAVLVKNMSLFSFSIRSVMQKYLEERNEITFDKIFNQKIGESCLFNWRTLMSIRVSGDLTVRYKGSLGALCALQLKMGLKEISCH